VVDVLSLRVLLAALVGWLDQQPQEALAYLIEENRILRGQLRGQCLRPSDAGRRRFAVRRTKEHPTWGYTRIRGALKNLGHRVGRSTSPAS